MSNLDIWTLKTSFYDKIQLHLCVVCLAVVLYVGFRHLQNLRSCHIVIITGASCLVWFKLALTFIVKLKCIFFCFIIVSFSYKSIL